MDNFKLDAVEIGRRVKALRDEAGMSVRDLEAASGVSRNTISVLERGEQVRPSMDKLRRIAGALGLPLGEVIGVEGLEDPALLSERDRFVSEWLSLTPSDRQLAAEFVRLLRVRRAERMANHASGPGEGEGEG